MAATTQNKIRIRLKAYDTSAIESAATGAAMARVPPAAWTASQ